MKEHPRTLALLTGGPFDGFAVEFDDPTHGNWVHVTDDNEHAAPVHHYEPGEWINEHERRYEYAPNP